MDEIYVTYVDDVDVDNYDTDNNHDNTMMIYGAIVVFDRVRSSQIESDREKTSRNMSESKKINEL